MLYLHRCMPHTSFLGFFTAVSFAIIPCLGEIIYLYFSYNATYIDHQAVLPSFWFRTWRPGFLVGGMLYDIGMLVYCIYTEDITAVLLIVRVLVVMYQLSDQYWIVKHWIPFFVQKQKQPLIFLRLYFSTCIWTFVLCFSNSWTNSWQERNHIFGNVYYINIFVITCGVGLPYLMYGGFDLFVKYRLHWLRNIFILFGCSGMIEGIVGLSIGDGGGNNLQDTLYYHSAFVMIYSFVECMFGVVMHYFIVIFEDFSWKYPNSLPLPDSPSVSPSTLLPSESKKYILSNKVACDVDLQRSSMEFSPVKIFREEVVEAAQLEDLIEGGIMDAKPVNEGKRRTPLLSLSNSVELMTKESNPKETVVAIPSENHLDSTINDTKPTNDVEQSLVVDGKEAEADVEAAACGIVPQSATVTSGDVPPSEAASPSVNTPVPIQRQNSLMVLSEAHRPFFLPPLKPSAVDGERKVVEAVKEEEQGKEEDVEAAARGLVPQSATVTSGDVPPSMAANPSVNTPVPFQRQNSLMVLSEAHRRFALAFDGITRRASVLRKNIVTHEIMMVKLKRHELVCREIDKLFCIIYQLEVWETIMWLAQIFLTLYLQSVNTPTPPGAEGYYCQTPKDNEINSAQFVNDFVFARRR